MAVEEDVPPSMVDLLSLFVLFVLSWAAFDDAADAATVLSVESDANLDAVKEITLSSTPDSIH